MSRAVQWSLFPAFVPALELPSQPAAKCQLRGEASPKASAPSSAPAEPVGLPAVARAAAAPAMSRGPASVVVDGRPVSVGLSRICRFCGAAPGIPCLWVARTWPDVWVHEARLGVLSKEERAAAERAGWIAVLLELLERGPIVADDGWRFAVQALLSLEKAGAVERPGMAGAVEELVRLGVAEMHEKTLRLRRPM